MTAFMVAAGLVAVAVLHAYRLAFPPRTDLVSEVGRWDESRARATRVQRIGSRRSTTLGGRLASWMADQVLRRSKQPTSIARDLAVTGGTLEDHLSKSLTFALAGFVGPVVILTVLDASGLGLPLVIAPVAGFALAVGMVIIVGHELRENAHARRAELRRSLSIYLDLVAMSMQAGRGHAEALPASAAIGSGWAFTQLQDAIDGARFSGITAWAALGRLGDRFGMRELTDLEGALRLANDDGAKVRATLIARAETLRAQRVADAEATSAHSTESMKFALIVMVFAFLTYELYPSVARLFAG